MMRGDKTNVAGWWVRWVGAVLIGAAGIVVLLGGLGMQGHPLRSVLGWTLLGYGILRVLINIWLIHRKQHSKLEIF